MPGSKRKKSEDSLLLALACGATLDAAARQCGVSERTIYRRLEDPKFKKRLERVRADMVGRTSGMLTAAGCEAIRTLLTLQKDSTPTMRIGGRMKLGSARRSRRPRERRRRG